MFNYDAQVLHDGEMLLSSSRRLNSSRAMLSFSGARWRGQLPVSHTFVCKGWKFSENRSELFSDVSSYLPWKAPLGYRDVWPSTLRLLTRHLWIVAVVNRHLSIEVPFSASGWLQKFRVCLRICLGKHVLDAEAGCSLFSASHIPSVSRSSSEYVLCARDSLLDIRSSREIFLSSNFQSTSLVCVAPVM